MILEKREKDIINFLLNHETTTITKIAEFMDLSNKTISQSLKVIDHYFTGSETKLLRKPKIGISLVGNVGEIQQQLRQNRHNDLPNNKEERVQYLCFEILGKSDYFTRQELQDVLYVGKTTLEKDMTKVNEIFNLFNVTIELIPGKGSFLNLMEQEKRKLAVDLIYYFWGYNWQVVKMEQGFVHSFEGIPPFADGFVNVAMLQEIDSVLQNYLVKTEQELTDMNYHSLLLHLLIAIERVKDGRTLELEHNEKEYIDDVELEKFIMQIEQAFDVKLPVSEIVFIQLHLTIDSKVIDETPYRSIEVNDDLIRQIIREEKVEYDEASLLGLVAHIKSVVERIRRGLPVVNPFVSDVKQSFRVSFEEAIRLTQHLELCFSIQIPEDEVAFLAVHIQAFKERSKEQNTDKMSALLVCSSGKGTSQLLAARLRRTFPEIEISRILSIQELAKTDIYEDVILSTVKLAMKNQEILYVSPVLTMDDQKKIGEFIENQSESIVRHQEFSQLIAEDFIFLDEKLTSYQEVISFIGHKLTDKKYATSGIIESAVQREELSFTSFGKFATPHCAPEYVEKSIIVFIRLKDEIQWGEGKVKYVFFICIKEETPAELELIYDNLLEIIDLGNKNYLSKQTKGQILRYLKEGN
ncbi:BglG family transcription antiterminator [Vagococcus salmoninarum]|uniref:BglG family transcription antiterminator n=1 Tax=Vagococcus salmoninarum TaxID=2739 RepID=UPI0028D80EB4|nr:BglG family transcription antiterminator [Vagococcus salmoninarum]